MIKRPGMANFFEKSSWRSTEERAINALENKIMCLLGLSALISTEFCSMTMSLFGRYERNCKNSWTHDEAFDNQA